jgi:hypothetical protein
MPKKRAAHEIASQSLNLGAPPCVNDSVVYVTHNGNVPLDLS